jgi:purine-binding chemotaxis protein CheW
MTMTHSETSPRCGAAQRAGKFLTFALGREEFGLEILRVREIIKMMDITAVPGVPECMCGVINLRGQVICVADLRTVFELPSVGHTDHTCIVVVELHTVGGRLSMGIVVDRVSEVCDIRAENIEDAPTFGGSVDSAFILGMGKIGSSVKILLDIDRVLGERAIDAARAAQSV